MSIAIIIPARFGSTRLPGKPLKEIAGHTMLSRVLKQAQKAAVQIENAKVYIATDDARIQAYAETLDADGVVMTPQNCATGSDRVYQAAAALKTMPNAVINLQGDVPLISPNHIVQITKALQSRQSADVVTPVVKLTWSAYHKLVEQKKITPFSGTTVTLKTDGTAHWFSKQIIPAIRKRTDYEALDPTFSPVYKHIGLYGYQLPALEKFVHLPQGQYENMEGLEQLRLLENNMSIKCVEVEEEQFPIGIGVDTEEDVRRVEALIAEFGDPIEAQVQ